MSEDRESQPHFAFLVSADDRVEKGPWRGGGRRESPGCRAECRKPREARGWCRGDRPVPRTELCAGASGRGDGMEGGTQTLSYGKAADRRKDKRKRGAA